jgi:hypothetical protein
MMRHGIFAKLSAKAQTVPPADAPLPRYLLWIYYPGEIALSS